jgi:hypothetical protein
MSRVLALLLLLLTLADVSGVVERLGDCCVQEAAASDHRRAPDAPDTCPLCPCGHGGAVGAGSALALAPLRELWRAVAATPGRPPFVDPSRPFHPPKARVS